MFLKKHWLPISLFLFSFVLYLYTLSPGWGTINVFNTWDGLEYVLSSSLLGIDHPPGHPFYLLLGKLFTLIPIGSIAYRINLLSALFGALTVVILFLNVELTLRMFAKEFEKDLRKAVAAFSALIFALSTVFWTHSLISEVHTLYLFLICAALYFFLRWRELKKKKWLYGLSFLLGLTLSTSIMNALTFILPIALFLIFEHFFEKEKISLKEWVIIIFLFVIPLLFYLYYPLRIAKGPGFTHPMNLISPHKLGSFSWLIWYMSGKAWTGAGMFSLSRIFSNIPNYFYHLLNNFTIVSVLLALVGFVTCIRNICIHFMKAIKKKLSFPQLFSSLPEGLKTFSLIFLTYLFVLIPQLSLQDPSNPKSNTYVYVANFYLPSFLLFVFFVGIGVSFLATYILKANTATKLTEFFGSQAKKTSNKQRRAWHFLIVYILLIIPVYLLAVGYPKCNLREGNQGGYIYAQKAIKEIPEGSLVLSKLVYQLVGTYFSKIEPVLGAKNVEIVNPDTPPYRIPGQDFQIRHLETARLKKLIQEYQEKNVPVYLCGDAVEKDKAPEELLLADVNFELSLPSVPPAEGKKIFPPELLLYQAESFRKAESLREPPEIRNRGLANDGNFADTFELVGYDDPAFKNLKRGRKKIALTFYWRVLQEFKEDLFGLFTVVDERMNKVDPQRTSWFFTLGGERGASRWKKGEIIKDEVYYYLPNLPQGKYFLALGLVRLNGEPIPYFPASYRQDFRTFDFVILLPFSVGVPPGRLPQPEQ
ncbi:MAG: DUF2723 domain-containing protein [Candidatus Aminicenantes bacterium]|nr:DUF2723 domain-containing protein [Candidatus Aminicenantes bacterium]